MHGISNGYVAAVNPNVSAQYLASTGYSTGSDGRRTPSYAAAVPVTVQMQMLTAQDLAQLSGLNIQGEKRAIYVSGNWKGVARPDLRGGDIFTLADGSRWLVAHVLENWFTTNGWAKVAATRQLA